MEPVSAAIMGTLAAGAQIFQTISARKAKRPDWLSPADFQSKDYTVPIIIGGMVMVLLIVLAITAWKIKR